MIIKIIFSKKGGRVKMKGKIKFSVIVVLCCSVLFLTNCTPYSVAVVLKASDYFKDTGKVGSLNYGEIEQQQVGKYTVKIDKRKYHGSTIVAFSAHNTKGEIVSSFFYNIEFDKKDLKEINDYMDMNETDKKTFIKKGFMSVVFFDLGPTVITAETSPKPEKTHIKDSDMGNYSTGFAPK